MFIWLHHLKKGKETVRKEWVLSFTKSFLGCWVDSMKIHAYVHLLMKLCHLLSGDCSTIVLHSDGIQEFMSNNIGSKLTQVLFV